MASRGRNNRVPVRSRLGNKVIPFKDQTYSYTKAYPAGPSSIEAKIKAIARKFVTSYYEAFDQPGRDDLEKFYNIDSFFSYSSTYPTPTFGRNLLHLQTDEQRISLLVHSRTNIANALKQFSPTEHRINQLVSDVSYYITNPMYVAAMQIVVTGVFNDSSQTSEPLRAFTRVLSIKQVSVDKDGDAVYEIFNDSFMLQLPTSGQIKKYHTDMQVYKRFIAKKQSIKNANSVPSNNNPAIAGLPRHKQDTLNSIMLKTRMNLTGSKKLLEENEWNEEKSMQVFNQLVAANQIPKEFFTT